MSSAAPDSAAEHQPDQAGTQYISLIGNDRRTKDVKKEAERAPLH